MTRLLIAIVCFIHILLLCVADTIAQGTFEEYLSKRMPEMQAEDSDSRIDKNQWLSQRDQSALAEMKGGKGRDVILADPATGLVIPAYPFEKFYQVLPSDDPRTKLYEDAVDDFFSKREKVLQLRSEFRKQRSLKLTNGVYAESTTYLGEAVASLNGPIFWAPASASTNQLTAWGDEVRSVFGPVPFLDVRRVTIDYDGHQVVSAEPYVTPGGWTVETAILGQQVDGNFVDIMPNPSLPDAPLQFVHKDIDGNVVKWTQNLTECDKPTLAGGIDYCGINSRLTVYTKEHIQWVGLTRKNLGASEEIEAEEYWLKSNPEFQLLGWIGFNSKSGEVAFFGEDKTRTYDWSKPLPVPGGRSYDDSTNRAAAEALWGLSTVSCIGCHDNLEPRTITPYLKQARIGFRDPIRRARFSTGDFVPESSRGADMPYRVVGTPFTAQHSNTLDQGRVLVRDSFPVGSRARSCVTCHTLTNLGTGTFALDAVRDADNPRTAWAKAQIHPWMTRRGGSVTGPPLDAAGIEDLENAIASPNSDSPRLCTEAPAPEDLISVETRIADPNGPEHLSWHLKNNAGSTEFPKIAIVTWKYHNWFGEVPTRDDVRFDLAFKERQISDESSAPPSIEECVTGESVLYPGPVVVRNDTVVIENASFKGHHKNTDPQPATTARIYEVLFPVRSGMKYSVRLLPKRFCFDRSGVKYSKVDHTFTIEVQE